MNFGERIRAIRTGAGITQADFAKLCGISLASLKNYETGKTETPMKIWRMISQIFGASLSMLIESNTAEEESAHLQALYQLGHLARQKTGGYFLVQAEAAGILEHWESITFTPIDYEIIEEVHKLNAKGQKTALERIRELAEIKKYKKQGD